MSFLNPPLILVSCKILHGILFIRVKLDVYLPTDLPFTNRLDRNSWQVRYTIPNANLPYISNEESTLTRVLSSANIVQMHTTGRKKKKRTEIDYLDFLCGSKCEVEVEYKR